MNRECCTDHLPHLGPGMKQPVCHVVGWTRSSQCQDRLPSGMCGWCQLPSVLVMVFSLLPHLHTDVTNDHWKWSFLYPMILRVRTPHTSPERRGSLGQDAWKTCSSRLWNRVFTNKYHHIPFFEKCWKQWFHSEQIYRTSFLHSQTRKMQSPWFLSSYRV